MKDSQQTYTRRVHFADTDAAGVVHFSKILCYIEEAIHFFLLEQGLDVSSEREGWPVVKVDIDYRKPLFFNDEVDISVEPFSSGKTSLSWSFCAFSDGVIIAEGILTNVRVDGRGKPVEVPQLLKSLVTEENNDNE